MENILQTGPSATRVQGLEEIAVVIRQVSVADPGCGPAHDVKIFMRYLALNGISNRLHILCLSWAQLQLQSHLQAIPVCIISCRQNDTTEDVVMHVMQPTVSSTRMVVGDIISGNNGWFIEEVRRAVEDAGHAAQAVRAQRELLQENRDLIRSQEEALHESIIIRVKKSAYAHRSYSSGGLEPSPILLCVARGGNFATYSITFQQEAEFRRFFTSFFSCLLWCHGSKKVMSTPTKDKKRCHITSGQTPNDKKKNRPQTRHASSRKTLDYESVERTNKSPSPCIRTVLQRTIADAEGDEDEGSARNPLRLHRLMRNQRENVAHFVPARGFLPARNERTVRQQHHRPRAGVPPPSGFLFPIEEENE
ncbi:hypothetical protein ACROYT_G015203 [Oculina patagonica]